MTTLFNQLRGMHYGRFWRPFVWSVWRVWFANLHYELWDKHKYDIMAAIHFPVERCDLWYFRQFEKDWRVKYFALYIARWWSRAKSL